MPKVSIIVPIYNVEKYIEECIISLISQSLKEIEIILINDGTPDRSGEICEKYKDLDNRITVIHKENGGHSSARNIGIQVAKGEYIGFVDGDDYVENNMFEVMYKTAIREDSDIAVCKLKYDISKRNYNYFYLENEKMLKDYIMDNLLTNIVSGVNEMFTTNKLYKRKLIIESNIQFRKLKRWEDKVFNLELLPYISSISYVPEFLYIYRSVPGSAVKSYSHDILETMLYIHKLQVNLINNFSLADKEALIELENKWFMNNITLCLLQEHKIKSQSERMKNYKRIIENSTVQKILEKEVIYLRDSKNISKILEILLRKRKYKTIDQLVRIYSTSLNFMIQLKHKIVL